MFFWYADSVVALLFLLLMVAGIRQRSWIFASVNFIGMALNVLVVFLDRSGHLNVTTLFVAMPALAIVLAADVTLIFQDGRGGSKLSALLNGKYLVRSEKRQDYLIVLDQRRLQAELDRHTKLSAKDRAGALLLWKQGNEAFLRRDYQEAETKYNLLVQLAPTPIAMSNLAGVLMERHRADAAVQSCERACALDPEHHEAWITRGAALLSLERHDEALECLDKATALQPNLLEPWIYRGNALRKMGQFQQAMECYDTALRINPTRPECWHEKALTLIKLEQPQEALKCFDYALQIDPDYFHENPRGRSR
jgi:tetratricopeptide (TPR) repeat protein